MKDVDIEYILCTKIEKNLVNLLLEHYKKLKQNFFLEQYEQSLLNSAKFVEIVFRVLEYITKGNYTPLNKNIQINSLMRYLENLTKDQYPDSIRLQIPKVLKNVYDIRSKRGAAHVSEINPNVMDATFVVSACDWILAELIRLYYADDPRDAQKIIHIIVERKVPIIEEFEGDLKVLNPTLTVADKILLILYKMYLEYVSTSDLKKWIKTKSPTHITTVLQRLDSDAKIHRRGRENKITKRGIDYVEKKLATEL